MIKNSISAVPSPTAERISEAFLGSWLFYLDSKFMALGAKPHEALKGGEMNNCDGMKITSGPLRRKTELSRAPGTGASRSGQAHDTIHSQEDRESTRGPGPKAGTRQWPLPYFPKQLGSGALRSCCLCVVAATALAGQRGFHTHPGTTLRCANP